MATKTLKQKLLEVSKSIKYLEKDKENKMQHYSYLSEAKIKEVFKREFEKNGVLFNYTTDDVREYEISPTSRGTKQFCTIAKGTYRFMDVDSDEEIVGVWHGSGTDTGDKGLYKAITGGIKYVINTNFLTPTGDDPENDDNDKSNGRNSNEKATPKPKAKTWKVGNIEYTNKDVWELMKKKYKGDKKKAEQEADIFKDLDKEMQISTIEKLLEEVAA